VKQRFFEAQNTSYSDGAAMVVAGFGKAESGFMVVDGAFDVAGPFHVRVLKPVTTCQVVALSVDVRIIGLPGLEGLAVVVPPCTPVKATA